MTVLKWRQFQLIILLLSLIFGIAAATTTAAAADPDPRRSYPWKFGEIPAIRQNAPLPGVTAAEDAAAVNENSQPQLQPQAQPLETSTETEVKSNETTAAPKVFDHLQKLKVISTIDSNNLNVIAEMTDPDNWEYFANTRGISIFLIAGTPVENPAANEDNSENDGTARIPSQRYRVGLLFPYEDLEVGLAFEVLSTDQLLTVMEETSGDVYQIPLHYLQVPVELYPLSSGTAAIGFISENQTEVEEISIINRRFDISDNTDNTDNANTGWQGLNYQGAWGRAYYNHSDRFLEINEREYPCTSPIIAAYDWLDTMPLLRDLNLNWLFFDEASQFLSYFPPHSLPLTDGMLLFKHQGMIISIEHLTQSGSVILNQVSLPVSVSNLLVLGVIDGRVELLIQGPSISGAAIISFDENWNLNRYDTETLNQTGEPGSFIYNNDGQLLKFTLNSETGKMNMSWTTHLGPEPGRSIPNSDGSSSGAGGTGGAGEIDSEQRPNPLRRAQ